jgi:hypothetical protein
MATSDKLALLCLLVAMFVVPAILGAIQQVPQRRPATTEIVQAPTATPLATRLPTPTRVVMPTEEYVLVVATVDPERVRRGQ